MGKIDESKLVIQESLDIARGISNYFLKSRALNAIFVDLFNLRKVEESLAIARGISDNNVKSLVLNAISIEMSKQGMAQESTSLIQESLKICSEILQKADRQSCLIEIASALTEQHGWEKALELCKEFKNEEAIMYYLKGWAESINVENISEELIQKAIPFLKDDTESMEHLLQLYAIHQLFFEQAEKEKINRYNRTLNLQWAIDIKNQLML
jgi:hypothetical protein